MSPQPKTDHVEEAVAVDDINLVVDGVNLEPAIDAAERVIATSPRKAVYEMAWDLARAAVLAAYPEIRAALSQTTTERSEG